MWLAYVIGHVFCLALVNYIDEYLTGNSKVPAESSIHNKIGGLLIISTLMSFVGAAAIYAYVGEVSVVQGALILSLISAVPMVIVFAAYFYLLTLYPAYLVVPLFLTSSLWMLLIEIFFGAAISVYGFLGIAVLLVGAYILDAGALKWQIPTRLLIISLPLTSSWAVALYLARLASESTSPLLVSFWQMIGIGIIGVALFVFVRRYRDGFVYRVRTQGRNFLGMSVFNESLSQLSYVFVVFAVASAPVTAYVTAVGGTQGLVVLGLFVLFPQSATRTKITYLHGIAVALIALGVFLIELSY